MVTQSSMHLAEAMYLTIVAALWGLTNPLLKKNSQGIEVIQCKGKISQMFAEITFLVSNWKYIVSFLLNQTGSLVYYITLSTADLTLAVPITNSMTFIFTAVSSHIMGERLLNAYILSGIALVAAGVLLCVQGKSSALHS
ncbi:transmembrane protein 234-like [Plakobranchus ocellatus]|uniref:Transmembrane protein 234-like n=1 Tax=Plakobranchus ocellatus TaxID=259542 RepID=A0AAV4A614_9GAST|nr:transmembrane protein 234-like [Plakobranchus ocellatus]